MISSESSLLPSLISTTIVVEVAVFKTSNNLSTVVTGLSFFLVTINVYVFLSPFSAVTTTVMVLDPTFSSSTLLMLNDDFSSATVAVTTTLLTVLSTVIS